MCIGALWLTSLKLLKHALVEEDWMIKTLLELQLDLPKLYP